jgi:hypothetical protein
LGAGLERHVNPPDYGSARLLESSCFAALSTSVRYRRMSCAPNSAATPTTRTFDQEKSRRCRMLPAPDGKARQCPPNE